MNVGKCIVAFVVFMGMVGLGLNVLEGEMVAQIINSLNTEHQIIDA